MYEEQFRQWLDKTFYEGFDPTDLSDEEYWELEDAFRADVRMEERV